MTHIPTTTKAKTDALRIADEIIERIEGNRLTQVPLLHLDELPAISGLYFATTDAGDILYIGKASDLTKRCNIASHHKLPTAIEKGATVLQIAKVDDSLAWAVEQKLIAAIAPELNDSVSQWWEGENIYHPHTPKAPTRQGLLNRLKEFCDARGITAYSVQRDTPISASTIYRLHKDPTQMPTLQTIDVLCEHYKVQPGEFIKWVPSEGTTA